VWYLNANDDVRTPSQITVFPKLLCHLLLWNPCNLARHSTAYSNISCQRIRALDLSIYRVRLQADDIPKLGVLLPKSDGEEQLVGLPTTLPMGWVNSPPFLCPITETITDLANEATKHAMKSPPHCRLENAADTQPATEPVPLEPAPAADASVTLPVPTVPCRDYKQRPLAEHDLYMDDFLSLAQGNKKMTSNDSTHPVPYT
jgi:hypothetical protein